MRKSIAIIAVVVFLCMLCLVAACGAKQEVQDAESSQTPQPEAPDSTPRQEVALQMVPWLEHTMSVDYALDDGTTQVGSSTAQGKYIKVCLSCVDGVMTWEEVATKYMSFAVRDKDGTVYEATSTGFTAVGGSGISIGDLNKADFSQIIPMFDVPKDAALDDLTLVVKPETEGEAAAVSLGSVPHEAPKSDAEPEPKPEEEGILDAGESISFEQGKVTVSEADDSFMFAPADMADTDRAVAVITLVDKALYDDETFSETILKKAALKDGGGKEYTTGATMTMAVDDKVKVTFVYAIPKEIAFDSLTFWMGGQGRRLSQ